MLGSTDPSGSASPTLDFFMEGLVAPPPLPPEIIIVLNSKDIFYHRISLLDPLFPASDQKTKQ